MDFNWVGIRGRGSCCVEIDYECSTLRDGLAFCGFWEVRDGYGYVGVDRHLSGIRANAWVKSFRLVEIGLVS